MSDQNRSPWGDPRPPRGPLPPEPPGPPEPESKGGRTKAALIIAGILGALFLVFSVFGTGGTDTESMVRIAMLVMLLMVVLPSLMRMGARKFLTYGAIWGVIILVTSSLYTLAHGPDPSDAAYSNFEGGALTVARARDGHFWVAVTLEGQTIPMMVDTGATQIVLSPDDARRIGFDPESLVYSGTASTANGPVPYATVRDVSVAVGDVPLGSMNVTVNGADIQGSLLGMRLLERFSSVEIKGDQMILTP